MRFPMDSLRATNERAARMSGSVHWTISATGSFVSWPDIRDLSAEDGGLRNSKVDLGSHLST